MVVVGDRVEIERGEESTMENTTIYDISLL